MNVYEFPRLYHVMEVYLDFGEWMSYPAFLGWNPSVADGWGLQSVIIPASSPSLIRVGEAAANSAL